MPQIVSTVCVGIPGHINNILLGFVERIVFPDFLSDCQLVGVCVPWYLLLIIYIFLRVYLSSGISTKPLTLHPLFCTMTNKCTIISQIMTLLYVSTLSCHPQGASTTIASTYRLEIRPQHRLHENCSKKIILPHFIVNRTILMF
jgi:hypothetical protein